MSTINKDPGLLAAAQAWSQLTGGAFSPGQIIMLDEILFHHSQDFSLAVYADMPSSFQGAVVPLVQHAYAAPDPFTGM